MTETLLREHISVSGRVLLGNVEGLEIIRACRSHSQSGSAAVNPLMLWEIWFEKIMHTRKGGLQ